MAELILSPIAQNIVGVLGSEAVKQIASIWGVNDELQELEDTISTIKAVLLDAEEKQVHNNQVKVWLERLVDVVHEADDLTDEFNTEALQRHVMPGNNMTKQVRTFFSGPNQLGFRHKMGRRIREIKKKLAQIRSDKTFLTLEVRSDEGRVVVRRDRDTHSFVSDEDVVGRDGDRDRIIRLLLDDDQAFIAESDIRKNVSVVSIVGMGGLGKTTLAQSVFNDKKVQHHFDPKIWVCVSNDFELKLVVQKILSSGNVEPLAVLQKKLRDLIGGKQYLLVLDDVWEENRDKWLKLEELLVCGAKGSRIVVTSRSDVVAKITESRPYKLGILDEEKSWSLFKKMAFKHGQEPADNPDLVKIARDVASKCGGIPLALRAIGSSLYSKRWESWSSLDKEFSNIISHQQGGNDILPTLKLSYDHLSSNLKHCFAYCRLFPKDSRIHVPNLINLWMAQGFLKLPHDLSDQCIEDVGYGYFLDLHERSFFQEVELDDLGIIKRCKMHDLVHDLAVKVAGSESEIVSPTYQGMINKNTHHVFLDFHENSTEFIPTSLFSATKLRTILFPKVMNHGIDSKISSFKLLRTLDLQKSGLGIVPDAICKLKHLRYLDLSWNKSITRLPNSITNLLNLQTLKLNYCDSLVELPGDIKKLVNLRHLEIDGSNQLTYMPQGLSQLTNLQTLSKYVLPKYGTLVPKYSNELKELGGLNNLRGSLEISNLRHHGNNATPEYESANLKAKQYLRSLSLHWNYDDATEESSILLEGLQPPSNIQVLALRNYMGVEWSSWLQPLTNLKILSISNCKNCKHLCPMSQLVNLKHLSLIDLRMLEHIDDDNLFFSSSKSVLPSLEKLHLSGLSNLKGWWRESGKEHQQDMSLPYFPRLSDLYIEDCSRLTFMPLFPDLESLDLANTSMKPFKKVATSLVSPLSKLTRLTLRSMIEDLECLPEWFDSIPSLEYLRIGKCTQLKDLSPGLQHLTSLRELHVQSCDSLTSIPECIRNLTSLKILHIRECTALLKRCRKEIGEESSVLLEGLQPPSNIQDLTFRNYMGVEWSSWLQPLTNLTILRLSMCRNCKHLCPMSQFLNLKQLSLTDLRMLEYIDDDNLFCSSSKSVLPSLEELRLNGLPNLKGWWRESGKEHQQDMSLPYFPRLSSLFIKYCSRLTFMPLFPNLERLILANTSMKPFKQAATSLVSPLSKLARLSLCSMLEDLECLPEWFDCIPSLEYLRIDRCTQLKDLSPGLQHLTSLRELQVWSCDSLTSIPECIHNLTSLKILGIRKCPALLKRCRKEIGEDWSKIAHIPRLELDPDTNQANDEPQKSE